MAFLVLVVGIGEKRGWRIGAERGRGLRRCILLLAGEDRIREMWWSFIHSLSLRATA